MITVFIYHMPCVQYHAHFMCFNAPECDTLEWGEDGQPWGFWQDMSTPFTDIFWHSLIWLILTLGNSDIEFCSNSRYGSLGMWRILTSNLDSWSDSDTSFCFCVRIPMVCPSSAPWGVTCKGGFQRMVAPHISGMGLKQWNLILIF